MDKDKLALGGSVLSAIVASLCCIGPLVAVVLGASGFAAAALFAKWRSPVPDDYWTFADGGMVFDLLASKSGQLLDGRMRTKLCGQVE